MIQGSLDLQNLSQEHRAQFAVFRNPTPQSRRTVLLLLAMFLDRAHIEVGGSQQSKSDAAESAEHLRNRSCGCVRADFEDYALSILVGQSFVVVYSCLPALVDRG